MIASWKGKWAKAIWDGIVVKSFPADLVRPAQRKLAMINAATQLAQLRVPPGNRLEALSGNRAGQHSIRINDQWRICFVWHEGAAQEVEITDYH